MFPNLKKMLKNTQNSQKLLPNKNLFFRQLNRFHVSLKEKSHDYPHLSTDIAYDSAVGINPSQLQTTKTKLAARPLFATFPKLWGNPPPAGVAYGLYLGRAEPIQFNKQQTTNKEELKNVKMQY